MMRGICGNDRIKNSTAISGFCFCVGEGRGYEYRGKKTTIELRAF